MLIRGRLVSLQIGTKEHAWSGGKTKHSGRGRKQVGMTRARALRMLRDAARWWRGKRWYGSP